MKKIVESDDDEGFMALLGEQVTIMCLNYIYTGKLSGVNSTRIKLTEAKLVYETGPWEEKGFKDAQELPGDGWYVQLSCIESFGRAK